MAQESQEASAVTESAPAAAPVKRRSRRVTRPAGTPTDIDVTPAVPAPQTEPTKAEPAQVEPAQAAPVKAEPAQSGPAQSSPAQSSPAQSGPAQAAPAEAAGESAPAKKAPVRRRAPRTKKATETAADQLDATAHAAAPQAESVPDENSEPKTKEPGADAPTVDGSKVSSRPPRRRATSKTSAPVAKADDGKPVVDVLAEFGKSESAKELPVKTGDAKSGDLPKLDIDIPSRPGQEKPGQEKPAQEKSSQEKPKQEKSVPEAKREEAVEVRLPATALLFQAPDIKPARRSTRPSASPIAEVEKPQRGQQRQKNVEKPDNQASHPAPEDESNEDSADESSHSTDGAPRRRRRGGRGRRRPQQDQQTNHADSAEEESNEDSPSEQPAPREKPESGRKPQNQEPQDHDETLDESGDDSSDSNNSSRRRRRRRSRSSGDDSRIDVADEVTALKGSTRLEAKRQRRREGRDAGRRRSVITEAEFLARRESVDRKMIVRELEARTQIAVLEDNVLVEHYVARKSQSSMVGNVYLGRVQNVLPSMEAAFVDLGRGRNAVLYAGEVNWDAAGLEGGQPRRIEQALSSGDSVLVQVTKDPIGHKGARLTSQITLAGRYLVLVPSGAMTGISRKLPEPERARLKKLLKDIVPEGQGVIVRTAAEGATEEELRRDVERLTNQWAEIEKKSTRTSTAAPSLLKGEPELATRVVRDIFNEDFKELIVSGTETHKTISEYLGTVAPDLVDRVQNWTSNNDVFAEYRIDEQLAKGMDRKVWLPSGGSLVIDRTEAMTVVDVNTGKFVGSGGTLEETVTRNNLESAEEIVRQLRLRDIGGIIVIDFIDMVLESNRDLVLRRLVECLGRDRTRHQVAEVTSLGLVQMTRKRVGQGLVEAFSHNCEHCNGRGFIVDSAGDHDHGPAQSPQPAQEQAPRAPRSPRRSRSKAAPKVEEPAVAEPEKAAHANPDLDAEQREEVKATLAAIAAAAASAHEVSETGTSDEKGPKAPHKESEQAEGSAISETKEISDVPAS